MPWYHVAEPNSYLVITGVGVEKVLIKKKVRNFTLLGYDSMLIEIGLCVSFPEGVEDLDHAF
jgi:hypothetical protein